MLSTPTLLTYLGHHLDAPCRIWHTLAKKGRYKPQNIDDHNLILLKFAMHDVG